MKIKTALLTTLSLFIGFNTFATENQGKNKDASIWQNRAKVAIEALNKNWYSQDFEQWVTSHKPEPLNKWHDSGENLISAWHSFNLLEHLIDYTDVTSDNSFIPIIDNVAYNPQLSAQGVLNGNDDMEWQGIAALKLYTDITGFFRG
jgi:hypothetical protein